MIEIESEGDKVFIGFTPPHRHIFVGESLQFTRLRMPTLNCLQHFGDCIYKLMADAGGLDLTKAFETDEFPEPLTARMAAYFDFLDLMLDSKLMYDISPNELAVVYRRVFEGSRLRHIISLYTDEDKEMCQRASCAIFLAFACNAVRDVRKALLKDTKFLKGLIELLVDFEEKVGFVPGHGFGTWRGMNTVNCVSDFEGSQAQGGEEIAEIGIALGHREGASSAQIRRRSRDPCDNCCPCRVVIDEVVPVDDIAFASFGDF